MNQLYKKLKEYGQVKSNASLAKYTTFKIGGPAKFLLEVKDCNKLVKLLNFLSAQDINYFVLGGGSNVLMPDDGFDGVIIKISTSGFEVRNNKIQVQAGVPLAQLVAAATQHSLTGMEWGAGIPGTVGGAVVGNAGAMGKDMSTVVDKIELWQDGQVVELKNQDCGFKYRSSKFKGSPNVVLQAYLILKSGDKKEILANIQKNIKQRSSRITPNPTPGCAFKNIELANWPGDQEKLEENFKKWKKVPAGWLIEQAGCKEMKVGGAMISPLHNNIIENSDKATQADVLALVERIKEKVYNKFGVELQEEMQIIK